MSEIRGPCLNVTAQQRMSLGRPRVWVSREGALPIWGASGAPLGVCVHEPPLRRFLSSEARNHLFSALGAKPKLSLHFCRVSGPRLLSFWDMCLPMPSGRLWLWAHCLVRSLLASGVTSSLGQLGFGYSWLLLPPLIVSLLMLLADHVVSCVRAHDSCLDTLSGTDQDRMSCLPVVRTVGRETVRLRSWCLKSLS